MLNPRPVIQTLPITGGSACHVIDDALLEPERVREFAVEHRERFAMAPHNAYPGIELRMSDAFSAQLDAFFSRHLRARLGARRTLRMHSRLALATLHPNELRPAQWFCHRDRIGSAPGHRTVASVLYLFDDPSLGGTSFYVPRRPIAEIEGMTHDAGALTADDFEARYGIARDYMIASNDYFEKVLSVPAQWNRLIFYDGGLFHSGDILHPERLDADPRRGRLTLNGFFVCSPALTAHPGVPGT